MKIIKLTKHTDGRTLFVNPAYIVGFEANAEGTATSVFFHAMPMPVDVAEVPDEIRDSIYFPAMPVDMPSKSDLAAIDIDPTVN